MTASAWTKDRVGRLKTLWLDGWSAEQIARELANGITRSAVLGKLHRLGLSTGRAPVQRNVRPHGAQAPSRKRRAPSAPAAPAARPLPPEPAKPAPEQGLASVLSVGRRQCRWPLGDPKASDFSLCGRPIARGAFCEPHAARAYTPAPETARHLERLAQLD